MDVFDFDGSGELEADERMAAAEILCTSAEEHEAFFGDACDFATSDSDDELEDDLTIAVLDIHELEFMDEDERREAIEDAGLDPDDYDMF